MEIGFGPELLRKSHRFGFMVGIFCAYSLAMFNQLLEGEYARLALLPSSCEDKRIAERSGKLGGQLRFVGGAD